AWSAPSATSTTKPTSPPSTSSPSRSPAGTKTSSSAALPRNLQGTSHEHIHHDLQARHPGPSPHLVL
ncbi:hypothetical protein EN859_036970, partial [Mesorhizobium sp. M00.F.Ca.ET.216.01.1.1]